MFNSVETCHFVSDILWCVREPRTTGPHYFSNPGYTALYVFFLLGAKKTHIVILKISGRFVPRADDRSACGSRSANCLMWRGGCCLAVLSWKQWYREGPLARFMSMVGVVLPLFPYPQKSDWAEPEERADIPAWSTESDKHKAVGQLLYADWMLIILSSWG